MDAHTNDQKALEANSAVERFCIDNIAKNARDLAGNIIEEVYIKVRPLYAVYRTANRVVVQYADEEKLANEQRKSMRYLNLVRAQISGLTSDWCKSKYGTFKRKAEKYDGRVASALILCLEGDGASALASLVDTKDEIFAERTSWGRFEYLISASVVSLMSIVAFTILQKYHPFTLASGNIWLSARAGTVGPFFSIALGIRNRTVLTNLHRRDNVADATLRILIGIIAAGVLILMLSTNLLPGFKIGDAGISGTEITWQTVLVVGFVAGFLERLVPDLLIRTTAAHDDKVAADGAVPESATQEKTATKKDQPRKGRRR